MKELLSNQYKELFLHKKKENGKILLVGAPNVGKSSFFNRITKGVSQVANYYGTTNSIVSSKLKGQDNYEVVDLPGTEGLSDVSKAGQLANSEVLKGDFTHAAVFLSALSFKGDLLKQIDFLESGLVSTIVVTQIDEQKMFHIAKRRLSNMLKTNSMALVSHRVKPNEEFVASFLHKEKSQFSMTYDKNVEKEIETISKHFPDDTLYGKRFLAIQTFLGNYNLISKFVSKNLLVYLKNESIEINNRMEIRKLIKLNRQAYVNRIVSMCCLKTSQQVIESLKKSRIDKVLLNKWTGILVFILIMSSIYFLSFSEWTGSFLQEKISQLLIGDENFIGLIGVLKQELIITEGQWFGINLILTGLITPIFLVISFFPYLFIFFFLTTLLSKCGYYSRAVILFDSILERVGLSGHSIISLIAGLGCSLPAIISTRSIPSKKERYITAFVAPLIPCSARLTVNTILVSLFFRSSYSWAIVIAITVGSGLVWLTVSLLLSKTLFRKENQWIVLPIPKWRFPNIWNLTKESYHKLKGIFLKMGAYLVIGGIIIYMLSALGPKGIVNYDNVGYEQSFLFYISSTIGEIFVPAGFGNAWQSSAALIAGLPAKEVIASTLTITSGGIAGLTQILSPAAAISFIVFSTFYSPCTPAIGLLHKETKDKKGFVLFHLIFSFTMAWALATVVYQLMSI